MQEIPDSPGDAVRILRTRAGMTQAQVAEMAAVSAEQLSRVETGRAAPSQQWLGVVVHAIASHMTGSSRRTTAA